MPLYIKVFWDLNIILRLFLCYMFLTSHFVCVVYAVNGRKNPHIKYIEFRRNIGVVPDSRDATAGMKTIVPRGSRVFAGDKITGAPFFVGAGWVALSLRSFTSTTIIIVLMYKTTIFKSAMLVLLIIFHK